MKDTPMEEDTIDKISDCSKDYPMEDIHISHQRNDPLFDDTVDNLCSVMENVKMSEVEKDFEDKKRKKRIKNSLHELELQLTENRIMENERDLRSSSRTTQTTETRTMENLRPLENLFIDLEAEETSWKMESLENVNDVLLSDTEESFENETEVHLGKKPDNNMQIENLDSLRKLIQNGQIGFGSHFRVRRRQLGFYEYYHHFLTLEANNQSMTVLHLTITGPFNIFCKVKVDKRLDKVVLYFIKVNKESLEPG
ncbi:uncharacterized protein LOC133175591 [Saccostrea echinata]|uniref:uncharacterized protein LOC133175591 n=1 Tax=Saccostrea echinata TaxID=191078 RepID=UPI002A8259DC|nr:uncharacterized protein LOC133175591 [Saccostrea echinata]